MKAKIKNIVKNLGITRFYFVIRKWYDEKTCSRFECGIGDILLCRGIPLHNQFLLTSRLLDVESYINGDDKYFPFQNAISYKAYGKAHREAYGNKTFQALIESYKKDGYHSDSFVTCDRDMELMDGNHRMGLQIYNRLERVNVRRIKRKINFPFGTDDYYTTGLYGDKLISPFLEKIWKKYEEVQSWLIESGNTFCAVVGETDLPNMNPLEDLSHLVKPLKIIKKGFYCDIDGINARWAGFIQFSLNQPNYDVEKGELLAKRAVEIERIMQSRYGDAFPIRISHNCLEGKRLFDLVIEKMNE